MARVLGIGGIFFKSPDPAKLSAWYREWLQLPIEDWGGAIFKPSGVPEGGYTVWNPFPQDTAYFDPAEKHFMLNLIVDDLDGALAQVKQGGAEQVDGIEDSEYGRFGWFLDPDGNKVELWQPPK